MYSAPAFRSGVKPGKLLALALSLALSVAAYSASAGGTVVRISTIREAPPSGGTVTVRGVVTAFSGWHNSFFLEDSSDGISVDRLENAAVQVGDQVEVTGRVQPGQYANVIVSSLTQVVGHGALPAARRSSYDELQSGKYDSRLVDVTGTLYGVRQTVMWGKKMLFLDVHVGDQLLTAYLLHYPAGDLVRLVDSQIRVKGVCGTIFNARRQQIGLRLFVASWKQVEVLQLPRDPATIPISRLESLLTRTGPALDHRVHVVGVVTYEAWGRALYLQEGKAAIRVINPTENWAVGTPVEAWGFVSTAGYSPALENALLRPLGSTDVVEPMPVDAGSVIQTDGSFQEAPFDGLLVELEAKVVDRLPNTGLLIWVLEGDGTQFQVQVADAPRNWALAFESGAKVKARGICVADRNLSSFHLLMRTPEDMRLLRASDWSQSLFVLLAAYLAVLIGSLVAFVSYRRSEKSSGLSTKENNSGLEQAHGRSSRWLALIAMALAGLIFGAALYNSTHPSARMWGIGPPALFASPCFLMTGIAIALQPTLGRRRVGKGMPAAVRLVCIWLVILVGGMELISGVASWKFLEAGKGFFSDRQLPLATALSLVLIGCSNLWITSKRLAGAGQVLAVLVAFTALMKLIGVVYGAAVLNGLAVHLVMSTPGAIELLILGTAVLLSTSDRGLMLTVSSQRLGGVMIRRLIPGAILAPVVVGWLRLQLQVFGLVDTRLGLTLFALSNALLFCFLIWSSATVLNRLDRVRSRAEQGLRERDAELEMIFATGTIGDFAWDVQQDLVNAHSSVWKMYGDVENRGSGPAGWFRQRQHPDDAERIAAEIEKMRVTGRPMDLEFRVLWPDGSLHWVYCRAVPVVDKKGNMLQTSGINLDITARKEAEARLRESEILFHELADAMPQIVWMSDKTGYTGYHNRRWCDYTGLPAGGEWRTAVPEADYDTIVERWTASTAKGLPYENEIRMRRASDGAFRWHLARAVPIFNSKGELDRWFGTCTDIDDFKRASNEIAALNESLEQRVEERSRELAETEQKYAKLVESVREYAIFLLDRNGDVASWNAGAQRLSRYNADEILGRPFSVFFAPADNDPDDACGFMDAAARDGRFLWEATMLRKDGSEFWASILISPIHRAGGEVSGFSTVVHDQSDWRRAKELLISAQKRAEEANRAKSSFLATMSHEIRTPMNSILGMADLLWESELNNKQRDYVGRFRRAGANLLTLINDILDLSKIESGRFDLESVEFDLMELLERVIEIAAPRASAKAIALKTWMAEGTPARLVGDPVRLQQILTNLVGNAIKFTGQGQVEVRIGAHADGQPGHIQFAVADSGIGIPAGKLASIFEDYSQAESSTTRRFGGTGLGLGICRRLVEKMGGRLSVESEFGSGSTFLFDVPLEIGEKIEHAAGVALSDLSGLPVLIVQADETNRQMLSAMCSEWGMKPSIAQSAAEGWERMEAARAAHAAFALTLLDRELCGGAEFSTLKGMKRLDPFASVIVLSTSSTAGEMAEVKAAGASANLLKPVQESELLASILATFSAEARIGIEEADQRELGPMKILLTDDSEDNRVLIEAYLADTACELSQAESGEEAIAAFQREVFDITLMDVHLNGMDGLSAVTHMRKLEREAGRTPAVILALTANALVDDAQRSLDAGCNGHLIKPISKDKLISTLKNFQRNAPAPEANSLTRPGK